MKRKKPGYALFMNLTKLFTLAAAAVLLESLGLYTFIFPKAVPYEYQLGLMLLFLLLAGSSCVVRARFFLDREA